MRKRRSSRAPDMLVKMRLESSEVQIPLVKVTKERNFGQKGCKNQHKIDLPSLSGLLEPWLPWLPPGCLLGASWEPSGSLLGASWESWVPLGSLLGASWVLAGCLLGASGRFLAVSKCFLESRCLHDYASKIPPP